MIDRAHRHKRIADIVSAGRAVLDWMNVSNNAPISLYQTRTPLFTSASALGKNIKTQVA